MYYICFIFANQFGLSRQGEWLCRFLLVTRLGLLALIIVSVVFPEFAKVSTRELTMKRGASPPARQKTMDGWITPKHTAKIPKTTKKPEVTQTNRFETLPLISDTASNPKKIRVPPIIMSGGTTHETITKLIKSFTTSDYSLKYTNNGSISVQCSTIEDFKKLQSGLKSEGINRDFHTFALESEKPIKSVIKGLPELDIKDIIEALKDEGFVSTQVIKMKRSEQRHPFYLAFFQQGTDLKALKETRYLLHTKVNIVKYKRSNTAVTQCFRCQEFGHGSSNCNRQPKCVKCALSHETSNCPIKEKTDAVKCYGCGGNHTANFRDCPKRQKYLSSLKRTQRSARPSPAPTTKPFSLQEERFPELRPTHSRTSAQQTQATPSQATARNYSSAARSTLEHSEPELIPISKLKTILYVLNEVRHKVSPNASKLEMALVLVDYLDVFYN